MKKNFPIYLFGCLIILAFSACSPKPSAKGVELEVVTTEFLYDTAAFPQCHASTIVETKDGLLASFFGGTHERANDVCIYTTRKVDGEQWSAPEKVADGFVNDTLTYPTWNPVLFEVGDRLYLYYKVGPSPTEWWGMSIYSTDEGKSWSQPKKLPENILGPIRNKPISLKSGVILSPSSIEYTPELWKAHIERSTNDGRTWTKIDIPANDSIKVIQPTLLVHPDGKIQALLRSNQNVIMQSWSDDDGLTWSEVSPTKIVHPNSGIDAVSTTSGWYFLVNNPLKSGESWEMGRNKLYLYASKDGINWEKIYDLEDQPQGEFSYPAIIQAKDGSLHITYTYNRSKIKHVQLHFSEE
ncbi:exo-alpha-sialidase [Mangrovibacterium marinum]|uniref:Putative neuraminidase n=1 Tax=Mangrovibacterium marinum TaxID=1639118 RepID=A0A2T5BYS1_9BACT|nr:sialidase family protein [Mangrovibacterium marinum]PTN07372.1 putative neuraminidase [Mangrovibacterium marinum]